MIIGCDVGGTKVLGVLIDPVTGAVVAEDRVPSAPDGETIVTRLAGLVDQLSQRTAEPVTAVGLGIAGLATRSGVLRYSPNLPELVEFPMAAELGAAVGLPVVVANDATAGAWGEFRGGAGRGVSDFVFITLGTGIGGGIVTGGSVLLGANGFGGEVGHMTVDAHGPPHVTGRPGPWEYFASGNALGRMGREAGLGEQTRGQDVAAGVERGDEAATAVFAEFCDQVALGAANLVMIFDPQRIIIGGGLTSIGEPLRAGVEQALTRAIVGAEHRPAVEVVLAELGEEANALGAGLLALEEGFSAPS